MASSSEVIEYVRACIAAGRQMNEIVGDLKNAGWSSADIADSLEELIKAKHSSPSQSVEAQAVQASAPEAGVVDKQKQEEKQESSPIVETIQSSPAKPSSVSSPDSFEIAKPLDEVFEEKRIAPFADVVEPNAKTPAQPVASVNSSDSTGKEKGRKILPWVDADLMAKDYREKNAPQSSSKPTMEQIRLQAQKEYGDKFSSLQKSNTATQTPPAATTQQAGQAGSGDADQIKFEHFDGGKTLLGNNWLSKNAVYIAVVAAVILAVIYVLYSQITPYLSG